jgi:hypothetical protein
MSSIYTLDPNTVQFDDKYVVFNPLHNELEYESTKENILRLGQLDPILILDGKCVDGRHRTKIAQELGVPVRCINVDPTTSEQDIIVMCNKNVMSGRDYDSTQKAIQALTLTVQYGMKTVTAATFMKVDRKLISYAATIKGYGREDLLNHMLIDKKVKVYLSNMDHPSRSLEYIAKCVKSEAEEKTVIIDDSERIKWEPDGMIKTEIGKAKYYSLVHAGNVTNLELLQVLVEYVNMKYKVQDESRE